MVLLNPLSKALGSVLVLAVGALGASMQEGVPFSNPFDPPSTSEDDGNSTADGNATGNSTGNATGNSTGAGPDGNATGNSTGNGTADGNQTADGNATGNATEDGNVTADPELDDETRAAVCSFNLYESENELMAGEHEWEWLVTSDVQHLWVTFDGGEGVPTGLFGSPDVRLVDGQGRTVAHATSGGLHVYLERGVDYLASGTWRLVYEASEPLSGYRVEVNLECGGED